MTEKVMFKMFNVITYLRYINSGLFSMRSFKLRKVISFFICSGSCLHARIVLGDNRQLLFGRKITNITVSWLSIH